MAGLSVYNLYILTVLGLGGFTYGFGFSVFVTALGQPGFYTYFKLDPGSTYAANIIGAVNALFTAGAAFGSLAQSPIADRYGRRIALATASLCSLIGGALAAGSVHIAMLIVVRITQGFGLGMLLALVPLYLSEIAAPRQRGLVTGVTVLSFGTGFSVCAWIAVGTFYANETVQWRVPLALACVSPLLMLIALPTIPETPRYLVWSGHNEQAWTVLRRLHHDPDDPEDRAAHAEFTQIVLQVEHDKENGGGFIQILKRPSLRKRALLVIFATWASVSTGVIGISAYLPLIFSGLGLEGAVPLVMYGVWTTIGTIGVALAIFIVDRVGRRVMLVIGYPLMAALLLCESLLQNKYLGTNDRGGLAACLVFLLMFIITYQCVDAPTIIWIAEIWPTAYRAKGISLGLCSYFVASLTYTTPSALAFKNIGWHMYLLYMGLCLICFVIVYFFIQETKDLPMEELAALFGDEVVVHITKDGKAITEDKDLDKVKELHIEQVEQRDAEKAATARTEGANQSGSHHVELAEA